MSLYAASELWQWFVSGHWSVIMMPLSITTMPSTGLIDSVWRIIWGQAVFVFFFNSEETLKSWKQTACLCFVTYSLFSLFHINLTFSAIRKKKTEAFCIQRTTTLGVYTHASISVSLCLNAKCFWHAHNNNAKMQQVLLTMFSILV